MSVDLHDLEPCGLELDWHTFTEAKELTSWLLSEPLDGWLCCTGEVRPWTSAEGSLPAGIPLSGEFVRTDSPGGSASVHLRQVQGGWKAWELRQQPGETHRVEEHEYVSTEVGRRLRYLRYWEPQPEHGVPVWRPVAARFAGWRSTR